MIELHTDTSGIDRFALFLDTFQGDIPFAIARSLNDTARDLAADVNRSMDDIFDRPTAFTERAAVAPPSERATSRNLRALVTLRPIQAAYLRLEETGGERTGADNLNKPSRKVTTPGPGIPLDASGNIPRGAVRAIRQEAARDKRQRAKRAAKSAVSVPQDGTVVLLESGAPGNKAGVTGFFRRLAGHRMQRLTAFVKTASYEPRMGYHDRLAHLAPPIMAKHLAQRLRESWKTSFK